ncbi:hypothetical protein M0805_009234 [Coniferiporia weirii]|nr:hypothetical protein M0805_009234 [Coniferiporia weirii]
MALDIWLCISIFFAERKHVGPLRYIVSNPDHKVYSISLLATLNSRSSLTSKNIRDVSISGIVFPNVPSSAAHRSTERPQPKVFFVHYINLPAPSFSWTTYMYQALGAIGMSNARETTMDKCHSHDNDKHGKHNDYYAADTIRESFAV